MSNPTIEQLAGSLSVHSAMVVQGNDVQVAVGGSDGKYGFELYRFERDNYRAIATSQPTYNTESDAREAADGVIRMVRSWDLTDKLPDFLKQDYVPPKDSIKV